MARKGQDMWSMINRELAKIEGLKANVPRTSYADVFTEALQYGLKERKYRDEELTDRAASLSGLIQVIDNPDSLNQFENQLNLYERDASGLGEHKVNALTLRTGFDTKKEMFAKYGTAIQGASDLIDSDEFLTEAADFENLPATLEAINKKRIDKGDKPHANTMEYVRSEVDRVKGLMGNMLPGMRIDQAGNVQQGFKYNKANNLDVETFNKMKKYGEQLEIATRALYVDGVINEGEAQAILIGDKDFYEATRKGAEAESKALFTDAKTQWNAWNEAQITDDFSGTIGLSDQQRFNIKSGSVETQKEVLEQMRTKYSDIMEAQDNKHFHWTGRHLQLKPEEPGSDYYNKFDLNGDKKDDKKDEKPAEEPEEKIEFKPLPGLSDSTNKDIQMKFDQARKRKPDMTQEEFIENVPKIKEQVEEGKALVETAEKAKSNVADIKTKIDSIPHFNKTKSTNIIHAMEDGKKVRYQIRVVGEGGRSISGKNIDDLAEGKIKAQDYWKRMKLEDVKIVYEVYRENPYTGKMEKEGKERTDIDNLITKLT